MHTVALNECNNVTLNKKEVKKSNTTKLNGSLQNEFHCSTKTAANNKTIPNMSKEHHLVQLKIKV